MERALFVRHGESEFSAKALVNGDPAVAIGLTELGRQQAEQLGERLSHPSQTRGVQRAARRVALCQDKSR